MIDPLTAVAIPVVYGVVRLASARAEAMVLHARTEVLRASAELSPGTEITSGGQDGRRWTVRVPARSLPAGSADEC